MMDNFHVSRADVDALLPDGGQIDSMMAQHVKAVVEGYNAALEAACEEALTGGTCGVLVIWVDDAYRIQVNPLVPYGKIYEGRLTKWDVLPGFLEAMGSPVAGPPTEG